MRKHLLLILTTALFFLCFNSSSKEARVSPIEPQLPEKTIVILHDNDVHCTIDNYPKMAGLRDAIIDADTAYVAMVTSGDFVQGGAVGSLSTGQYVVDIMKSMNYDAITLGNHEFDYGVPRMQELMAQFPEDKVTCCNFFEASRTHRFYSPYILKKMGNVTVAFIGMTTPGTLLSEAYSFYDKDGNLLYELCEDRCIELVQNAVDDARQKGASYVVLLAHLGEVECRGTKMTSPYLLANTTGIDVVVDGHSHSTLTNTCFPNRDGRAIPVTQTGTTMANVGKVLIGKTGAVTAEMLKTSDITYTSSSVEEALNTVHKKLDAQIKNVVCTNEANLSAYDEQGQYTARYKQMALGELICEAFRYVGGTQIGMINGGSVRASMPKGDVTYEDLLKIMPFGNNLQTLRATGQQILDALEVSVNMYPKPHGDFLQVAGLRYEFDHTRTPALTVDPMTLILSVEGERRITKCEVKTADGSYEAIIPDSKYTITSNEYCFTRTRNIQVLAAGEIMNPDAGKEVDAFVKYVDEVSKGHIR